jgi:hypothetical protein
LLALLSALPCLLFEVLEQRWGIWDAFTGIDLVKPYLQRITEPQRPSCLFIVL